MTYVKVGALFSLLLVTELLPERLALPLLDALNEGGRVLVLLSRVCLALPFKAGLVFPSGRDKPACTKVVTRCRKAQTHTGTTVTWHIQTVGSSIAMNIQTHKVVCGLRSTSICRMLA